MVSPATSINVTGNVEGSIVIGDNNFVVNNNHGTIVYKQAGPQARLRDLAPRPPRAPRAFVGRECELQELAEWVDKRQPVLLEGIDGVGKTTLLKQAANSQAAQNIKNGVVYLEGIDQSGTALAWEDIRQLLFDALFESDPQLKVNAASARTYLSNTSPLVLLDNLQLDEEALEDLADLFPQSPIIAVSTKRMDSDVFERYPIDPLPPGEAIDLLATRAKLTVDDTNRAALEKLTASLNYLPLTLVTVGNAIREYKLSLEQALVGLNAIQVAGAQPIKVAIERSILFAQSFLSSEERQMLGLAAAAPAISTSREFLEKTSGGAAVSTQLENLSLLQANSPRLRLHPEYAPFVLQNSDIAVVRFKLASAIMDGITARPLDFDFIKAELGNLLGLIEWSASQGNSAEVFKMARATFPYVVLHGLWDAWRRIMEFVLKAARHVGDQVQEAWALHELGTRMIGTGELTGAEIALRQALKLRQDLGDTEGAAYTLHNLDYLKKQGAVPPESGETTPVTTRRRPALFRWIVIGLILLLLLLCISTAGLARAGAITLPPGMTWLAGMPAPSPTPTQTLTPTFTLTPSPTSTATSTATHTMTPTSTFTLTPTVTPSPTATQTPTLTPTPTITVTPTITGTLTATPFAFPTFTAKMQAYCNYGPGPVPLYLPAADIFPGDTGTVHGRNATSTWLYVQLDKNQRYCWAATSTLDVTGDIKTVNITPTKLPFSPQSPPPTGITATRKGDQVTITWDPMPVAARDFRGYLLTVNTCVNGLRTPQIVQTNNTSYVFTDGNNCSGTSKGQIQSVTVQGYSNPVPIEPWP